MVTRYWWAVVRRLDRPGRRGLLTLPGSAWVSLTYRAPCLVYWRDGAWIHHYRGAKIPHASLGRAAPPRVFTAQAREMFLHEYTPRAGDVVFDIGAGIGAEMLLFSRLVGPSGRVVSVEAHPRTYKRLVDLCKANRLGNVTRLQVAVSDTDGTVVISDLEHHLRNTVLDRADRRTENEHRRSGTACDPSNGNGARQHPPRLHQLPPLSRRRRRRAGCSDKGRRLRGQHPSSLTTGELRKRGSVVAVRHWQRMKRRPKLNPLPTVAVVARWFVALDTSP